MNTCICFLSSFFIYYLLSNIHYLFQFLLLLPKSEVYDHMENGERERPEYRHAESRNLKSRNESCEEPKEKSIDDEGEEPEGQHINRKRQDKEDRFEHHSNDAPQKSEEKRGDETLHMDSGDEIGNDEEHEC